MQVRVILEPSEEGGFTVHVPSLPGCISEGDTREEALANIREAIQLHLEPVERFINQKIAVEWAADDLFVPAVGPTTSARRARYATRSGRSHTRHQQERYGRERR